MSKADTLLKKASFFERLALYSDRKSYLQALAQETPAPALDKNTRNLLLEAQQIMQNAGLDASAIGNVTVFNKLDQWGAAAKSIRDALMLGKLSPLSDEYKRLQAISTQLKAPASPPTEAEQAMAGPADITFQPDRITAIRPIDKKDQEAVFRFVTIQGLGIPGKIDGQLGKETRTALEAIKDYFAKANPQNKRMSDQEAIQAAKFQGR